MPQEISEKLKDLLEGDQSDELISLLRENLKKNEEILKISRDVKKYMRWQNIWSITRILVIAIPLIVGAIYLPPLIKEYIQSYQTVLSR
jgi:cation transport ATPase